MTSSSSISSSAFAASAALRRFAAAFPFLLLLPRQRLRLRSALKASASALSLTLLLYVVFVVVVDVVVVRLEAERMRTRRSDGNRDSLNQRNWSPFALQSIFFNANSLSPVESAARNSERPPNPEQRPLPAWISSAHLSNPLIDDYGQNDAGAPGEDGRQAALPDAADADLKERERRLLEKHKINVVLSDVVPLNRRVPDSRHPLCASRDYDEDLPDASVIVPFHNEWPSVLLRTIYSLINRTPWKYLREIVLVDDASSLPSLGASFDDYLRTHFPQGLVRLLRLRRRIGLIKARNEGWRQSEGRVVVFLDSHMEVNYDWLRPLLQEIRNDPHAVAMAQLDYVDRVTFSYDGTGSDGAPLARFGFDWPLNFFDLSFRKDQLKKQKTPVDSLPGAVMVGSAFAINSSYFGHLGAYDEGMDIWGGENLEMSFRVWMCGGRLLHVPCAHIGHVHRTQKPYTFPGGGQERTEIRNYLRVAKVWLGEENARFFEESYPGMNLSAIPYGDISSRLRLKTRLGCRDFSWYLKNVYPELVVPNVDVRAWGGLRNSRFKVCLDTANYVYQKVADVITYACHYKISNQGFMWTNSPSDLIRSPIQCLIVVDGVPKIQQCLLAPVALNRWRHSPGGQLRHVTSGKCLDVNEEYKLTMSLCSRNKASQKWTFRYYVEKTDSKSKDSKEKSVEKSKEKSVEKSVERSKEKSLEKTKEMLNAKSARNNKGETS